MKVKDKVCVVTGAAAGIGEAIARRYAREGAKGVILADLAVGPLRAVAEDIKGLPVACDVAHEAAIKHLVAEAERHYGPVDVFFSNAGIGRGGHEDATDKDWADSWAIHVMAHVYAARALVPAMLRRGSGYLLNTASAAGLLASMGSAPYGVTKHAAVALAEHLSIQYGDKGICVSVLCPQAVDTNMLRMAGATAASVDGVLNTEAVAETVIHAMDAETFLILPHPAVKEYMLRKTGDYDRWLRGMRRLRDKSGEGQHMNRHRA
jgi:NAD(P)-dependent dehydrogenase (short-subunit alcohol dehydrogenase family)